MGQKNRSLTLKFERAKRERREYAAAETAREASRPAHAASAVPIVAAHWGITPEPISRDEVAQAVADFEARGRIKKIAAAAYNPRVNGLNRYASNR
jgi:hypothetical protein